MDELLRDREIERLAALFVQEQEKANQEKAKLAEKEKKRTKEESDRKRKQESTLASDEAPPKRKRAKPTKKKGTFPEPEFLPGFIPELAPPPSYRSVFKPPIAVALFNHLLHGSLPIHIHHCIFAYIK